MISLNAVGIKKFNREMTRLAKKLDKPERFFSDAKNILRREITDHFRKEEGPSGKWKELSQSTIRQKGSSGILKDSGHLKQSLLSSGKHTSNYAVVGTNVKYGPIHNFGGSIPDRHISPKQAKALSWITAGGSRAFSKGHTVSGFNMPERKFLWLSRKGGDKLLDSLHKFIDEELK